MRKVICLIIFLIFACVVESTTLRCGTYVISEGDMDFEVLEKCGEPDSKEVEGYIAKDKNSGLGLKQEVWIYKKKNKLYRLEFYGTVLKNITTHNY